MVVEDLRDWSGGKKNRAESRSCTVCTEIYSVWGKVSENTSSWSPWHSPVSTPSPKASTRRKTNAILLLCRARGWRQISCRDGITSSPNVVCLSRASSPTMAWGPLGGMGQSGQRGQPGQQLPELPLCLPSPGMSCGPHALEWLPRTKARQD